MAKQRDDARVTILIVGGILALVGAWFSLPALAADADPIGDCVERALDAVGTRVDVSPEAYEDIKQTCEKGSAR
jgi:hypothetical protein